MRPLARPPTRPLPAPRRAASSQRQHRTPRVSAAAAAQQHPSPDAWARVALLRRELDSVTSEEDYESAVRVRDALTSAARSLPLGGQLMLAALSAATQTDASADDRASALLRVSDGGHVGEYAWPALARLLHDQEAAVAAAAEAALTTSFRAAPCDAARAAFDDGDQCLRAGVVGGARGRAAFGRAIASYSAAIKAAPDWAEAWNARATARYLGGDFSDSLADCQRVLALNPHHWGAASGAGMVYLALAQRAAAATAAIDSDDEEGLAAARTSGGGASAAGLRDAALACLEFALGVHPRLAGVRSTADTLRQGGAEGGGAAALGGEC